VAFKVNTGPGVVAFAITNGGSSNPPTSHIYDYTNVSGGGVKSASGLNQPPGSVKTLTLCFVQQGAFAVATQSFRAARSGNAVTLRWRTASERDTLGFNVYRLVRGHRVKLNKSLLPAASLSSSSAQTRAYAFRAKLGSRKVASSSRFVLAEVHRNGSRTLYGPVRATAAA
jgi:hypothetical protein